MLSALLASFQVTHTTNLGSKVLLLSPLYREGIEAQKGQVSCPRSQSGDGTITGPQADSPFPGSHF